VPPKGEIACRWQRRFSEAASPNGINRQLSPSGNKAGGFFPWAMESVPRMTDAT
jgi:hypothetical protein